MDMTKDWQAFVATQGGVLGSSGHTEYFDKWPYAAPSDNLLIDGSLLATLVLSGPDAQKFLQGQITQDVKLLDQSRGFFTDTCNPKGRIIGSFIVLPDTPEQLRLLVPANNAEHLLAHFKKYLVFSKATLSPSDAFTTLILSGPSAPQQLANLAVNTPEGTGKVVKTAGQGEPDLLAYQSTDGALMLNLPAPRAQTLWLALQNQLVPAGARAWRSLQIHQGIVWVDGNTREHYTPHQLNHQHLEAISFRKGCYTGQEVVARMHYKATLKSHTYLFTLTAAEAPSVFDEVRTDDQKVGEVVCVESTGQHQWALLADVKTAALDQPLHLGDRSTEKLHQDALPYAINN